MGLKKYFQVITVGDIIIAIFLIVAVFVTAGFFWWGQAGEGNEVVAVIEQHREEIKRVDMPAPGENKEVKIDLREVDYEATVELEHNRARIHRMPEEVCPLGICADTGWISQEGQAIVCAPNNLVIYLEGAEEKENDIDTITH